MTWSTHHSDPFWDDNEDKKGPNLIELLGLMILFTAIIFIIITNNQ